MIELFRSLFQGHSLYLLLIQIQYCLLQGSGHDLYGGFPGYSPMMFSGSGGVGVVEQAMPATGLGPIASPSLSPGSGMVQGLPPHYNGSYHPGYMQQGLQVGQLILTTS